MVSRIPKQFSLWLGVKWYQRYRKKSFLSTKIKEFKASINKCKSSIKKCKLANLHLRFHIMFNCGENCFGILNTITFQSHCKEKFSILEQKSYEILLINTVYIRFEVRILLFQARKHSNQRRRCIRDILQLN